MRNNLKRKVLQWFEHAITLFVVIAIIPLVVMIMVLESIHAFFKALLSK